jgi:hypothetical protein
MEHVKRETHHISSRLQDSNLLRGSDNLHANRMIFGGEYVDKEDLEPFPSNSVKMAVALCFSSLQYAS